VIYNIPEVTPPEVSFDVSDQLRSRVNAIKAELVTRFPTIKSSQYNPGKLEH
jgi:hypothetical protein